MAITFTPFVPTKHGAGVLELWDAALGATYPISGRVFYQRTVGNPFYDEGDGMVPKPLPT